jgi:hypothetical protein
MHAVVFQVDMKEGREEKESREELVQLIGFVKTVPGFVRGTWLGDGRRGLSVVVFESEEAARNVADNASMPPDSTVSFRSADVYEVWGEG